MKRYLCLYFLLACLISACGSVSAEVSLRPPATLPTSTKIPTATATQRPTSTAIFAKVPRPTSTATAILLPTATPIILPTKQILAQFGIFGGDGGSPSDAYFGRDTPQWVLYSDGQLLVRKSDKKGDWFAETTLTVSQMCALLSRIQRTGFFQIQGDGSSENDPIYQYGGTTPLGDEGASYVIQVNGQLHKLLYVYPYYAPYLSPEAKAIFNLFSNYADSAKLIPYQAQYALLWIEEGQGDLEYAIPAPTAQAWPTDIPSLESLSEKNIETSWLVDERYKPKVSQVLIKDKDVQPILSLFGNHLAAKLFNTSNGEYYVIARPLLPHELPGTLSAYPYQSVQFDLPFKCGR